MTGELIRFYNSHKGEKMNTYISQLEELAKQQTIIQAAIQVNPVTPHRVQPFVKSYGIDHPLISLFRASLLCIQAHKRIPDILFIHSSLERPLAESIFLFFGETYDGTYPFYAGGQELQKIGVGTNLTIPANLFSAIGGCFTNDLIVASFNGEN